MNMKNRIAFEDFVSERYPNLELIRQEDCQDAERIEACLEREYYDLYMDDEHMYIEGEKGYTLTNKPFFDLDDDTDDTRSHGDK